MATVSLASSEGKWLMTSTILASSMAFIDGTALNVILPALQQNLNASGADLFWILNSYLLMLASLILIGGTLGDSLGRKKIFIIGIFIFVAGSAICGLAADVRGLIISRIIQGIGGALMIPGSLSLISSSINEQERGKAIGTWSAFTTFVTLGGPILGGALADAGLWRYIFFINVPIGIAALTVLWFKVEATEEGIHNQRLDYTGALLVAVALGLLTFGFLKIPETGLHNAQTYLTLGAGFLLIILFVYVEYKSEHPMMPLALFADKTFSGANLLTFFLYAGLGGGMLFLSLNLVQIQGYSQLESGLTFLPFTVLMILLARFAGKLADKFGPRLFLIFGPVTAGTGLLLLSFVDQTNGPQDYWITFFPGILVLGAGMAFTVAPLTTAVMASVNEHLSGTASGINNAMTRVASVFANAIFGGLAVLFFSGALSNNLSSSDFSSSEKTEILNESGNLGNAQVPGSISLSRKVKVQKWYQQGFLHAYSIIMKISASLGFLGGLMAFLFVRVKVKEVRDLR